jgi:DNA-directed RNA polymerase specialized sigma24 family protein
MRSRGAPAILPRTRKTRPSFFAHLLETKLVRKAGEEKGRFRSFLLSSFKRFIGSENARARAQKRGGDQHHIRFELREAEDRFADELADDQTPDKLYDRSWAQAVLSQAFQLLEAESVKARRQPLFEELHPFLQGEKVGGGYAEVARRLNTTEGTIKVTVSRMRRRYRELLRAVIAQTVDGPVEVEQEFQHLVAVLRG